MDRRGQWRGRPSEILDSGVVPTPPGGRLEPGVRHPLAVDRHDDLGAISFAVLDLHPRIAKGMWCEARVYARGRGGWVEIAEHDNTTSPHPFERPPAGENSDDGWIDWHSNGGLGGAACLSSSRRSSASRRSPRRA